MRAPVTSLLAALGALVCVGDASAAQSSTYDFKADKTPLEGPGALSKATMNIVGFGYPCGNATRLAFVKSKNDVKIFKAQCDGRKWYVILQSPEGRMKVFEWSGAGEPH